MLFAVILGMPVPFLSLMLLWANIFVGQFFFSFFLILVCVSKSEAIDLLCCDADIPVCCLLCSTSTSTSVFADIPPSLSLGLEVGEVDAMNRPPRKADATILSLRDCAIIALDSGFMAVMLLVNYYIEYNVRGTHIEYARTFAFMLLAMLHLVHSFESRSLTETMFRRDIFSSNPTLAWAFVVSMGFLVLGCYCPGLQVVIELQPLEGTEWGIIFINLAIHLTFVEGRKFALRCWMARAAAKKPTVVKGEEAPLVAVQQVELATLPQQPVAAANNVAPPAAMAQV